MAVNIQKTMKPVKQMRHRYSATICLHVSSWRPSPTGKLPKIRPSEFHCQLKILVTLILDPTDTSYQFLGFFLRLLLEFGPVRHGDAVFKRRSYLDVTQSPCSLLVSYCAGNCAAIALRKWSSMRCKGETNSYS